MQMPRFEFILFIYVNAVWGILKKPWELKTRVSHCNLSNLCTFSLLSLVVFWKCILVPYFSLSAIVEQCSSRPQSPRKPYVHYQVDYGTCFRSLWQYQILLTIWTPPGKGCARLTTPACLLSWEHLSEMFCSGFRATSMCCSVWGRVGTTIEISRVSHLPIPEAAKPWCGWPTHSSLKPVSV